MFSNSELNQMLVLACPWYAWQHYQVCCFSSLLPKYQYSRVITQCCSNYLLKCSISSMRVPSSLFPELIASLVETCLSSMASIGLIFPLKITYVFFYSEDEIHFYRSLTLTRTKKGTPSRIIIILMRVGDLLASGEGLLSRPLREVLHFLPSSQCPLD